MMSILKTGIEGTIPKHERCLNFSYHVDVFGGSVTFSIRIPTK